jgi:predicted nucleic acid-binding protein
MISTFTVVFDANVLFSIRLTSLLMHLAMSGLFRARWSVDIHREWMDAVAKQRGISADQLAARRDYMDAAVLDCRVSGYDGLIPALELPDPNDRHVLAAAICCGADAIVTFNERDFPESALDRYGVHTRHPDDFILDIHGLHPGALVRAAKDDLGHYTNPSLDVDTYIGGLRACGVPKTADRLQKTKVLLTS